VAPGTLPTPAIQGKIASIAAKAGESVESATEDYLAVRQPSGRFIGMEAVGALVVFLCSAAAQDITGACLPIDGGWSIA
jgi:3-hydroxybutyrate dehydrogenase